VADADPQAYRGIKADAEPAPVPVTARPELGPEPPVAPSRRRKLLAGIAGAVLLGGIGFGGYEYFVGSHYVSTDNAYVGADTAQVTPQVAGTVIAVEVNDTQSVRRGQVLMRLDDRDARIALAQAEADLARARREFGRTAATGSALQAQVTARQADIARARAQVTAAQAAFEKARVDLARRQRLAPNGAVSGDELTSAVNAFESARASVAEAQAALAQASATRGAATGELAANQALTSGLSAATSPDVLAAQARVEQARLDLERTVLRASVDGVIANRTVQVGQRVAPGAVVMRVVPVGQVYVDANFKEGQLARVRPGQSVTLTSDLYGGDVVYHGRVVGFSGGTGSAFALIPAQNATGNWIKVVQRLPVRVRLDPKELAAHPLRVGLSMDAEIEVGE
jgi:membrane fusion protein (multidrug efflux system)